MNDRYLKKKTLKYIFNNMLEGNCKTLHHLAFDIYTTRQQREARVSLIQVLHLSFRFHSPQNVHNTSSCLNSTLFFSLVFRTQWGELLIEAGYLPSLYTMRSIPVWLCGCKRTKPKAYGSPRLCVTPFRCPNTRFEGAKHAHSLD